jgi:hypothetical protein
VEETGVPEENKDSESDLSHYMISVGTQPDKSVIDYFSRFFYPER